MNTNSALKKKLSTAAQMFFALMCALCLGGGLTLVFEAITCSRLMNTLVLPELRPLRFVVYGAGTDTVSARFRLSDADNHEIALIERSWNGSDLYIEFAFLRSGKKTLLLPRRVYTEEAKNHSEYFGTYLPRYYMSAETCLLYSGISENPAVQKDFSRLARYALSRFRLPLFALRRERIAVPIYAYERGEFWGVTIFPDGTLIISEE